MNSNEIQKIFQTIRKKISCPQCGKRYDYKNIHIIKTVGNICFLQLECGNHFPTLATVAVSEAIDREQKNKQITADEILAAHNVLEKIKSIEELFK